MVDRRGIQRGHTHELSALIPPASCSRIIVPMSTPENTPETPDQPATETPAEESIGAIIKRLGPAAWLPIAWAVLPAIAGITLLVNMDFAQKMLIGTEENPGLPFEAGVAVFVGVFIVTAGLGILPTVSQAILAGFAFGISWGFPAALI